MSLDHERGTGAARPRAAALFCDRHGSSFVQTLILVGLVAFGAIIAFRALGDTVGDKAVCSGKAIASFNTASAACSDGSGVGGTVPPAPPVAGDAPPGTSEGGGDGSGGNEGGSVAGNSPEGGSAGDGGGGKEGGSGGEEDRTKFTVEKVKADGFTRRKVRAPDPKTFGGAPPRSAEEREKDERSRGVDVDVGLGVEHKFLDEKGSVAEVEANFAGGKEELSVLHGKLEGTGFARASVEEGVAAGGSFKAKGSAVHLEGEHTVAGVKEKHEVDVGSVKAELNGKAGISKDVVGATGSFEAGLNLAEAKVEVAKVIDLPFFVPFDLEAGGGASAAVGANIGGQASAGAFRGEDGKFRIGARAGGKAALGLGLGLDLNLNLVF
jgi:hypothetical protein